MCYSVRTISQAFRTGPCTIREEPASPTEAARGSCCFYMGRCPLLVCAVKGVSPSRIRLSAASRFQPIAYELTTLPSYITKAVRR